MSEPQQPSQSPKGGNNTQTILFMVILSFICALILSILASVLAEPKEVAKDLDRSKQLLIAAHILNHEGYFLAKNSEGSTVAANLSSEGDLVPVKNEEKSEKAANNQIIEVYKKRVEPILVDGNGKVYTFQEVNLKEDEYVAKYKKTGYYKEPYKLLYRILTNTSDKASKDTEAAVEAYVIPVNGMGLWDAIYGYLAINPNGNEVIGITWYDQKETPGLGANMADAPWQSQFPGKTIFQGSSDGKIDLKTAPLGIVVVKGKVNEVLGTSPKAKSAVDGMSGATLTGNGITDAYKNVLNAYRPFLIKLHKQSEKTKE